MIYTIMQTICVKRNVKFLYFAMENLIEERLGQKLCALRKSKGLTQEQLSEKLELNSRENISNWERDKPTIPPYRLKQLAAYFGLNAEDIEKLTSEQLIKASKKSENHARDDNNSERMFPVNSYLEPDEEGFYFCIEATEQVFVRFSCCSPDSYILKITGRYLVPKIEQGEYIIVAPNIPVLGGDIVLVSLADGRKTIHRFLYERNNTMFFLSINKKGVFLEIPSDNIENLSVITATIHHPYLIN